MKYKRKFFTILVAFSIIGFSSCSDDDNPLDGALGGDGCADYADELQTVSNAATAYSENQTPENCEAYKDALRAFYEEFRDCAFYENGDYEEDMNDIENMDCS